MRDPIFDGPVVGSPMPAPIQSTVSRVDIGGLTVDSPVEDFMNAIDRAEKMLGRAVEIQDHLKGTSDRNRLIVSNLNEALRNAREFRDQADRAMVDFGYMVRGIEGDLKLIRELYQDKITKQRELDLLHEELDAIKRLAATKPWGKRMLPYQLAGARQICIQKRVMLCDQMGLGKTLQAIMAMDMLRAKKVLIICPNDVLSNFTREVNRWTEGRDVIPLGDIKDKRVRHKMLKDVEDEVEFTILLNYEAWRRDADLIPQLIKMKFDMIVCDEAHNMKNIKSKNFDGVRRLVYAENLQYECENCGHKFDSWPYYSLCGSCGKSIERKPNAKCSVKYVVPMTGTSVLNADPRELFPLLNLIDRDAFAKETDFLKRYCTQTEHLSLLGTSYVKKWSFGHLGQKGLLDRLGPKYIRRTRETAGVSIPEQDVQNHYLEFEDGEYLEQQAVIANMKKFGQILMSRAEVMTLPNLLVLITRLRQAITMPSGIQMWDPVTKKLAGKCEVEESIKVDYAVNLISDIINGGDAETNNRVVLFSQFKEPLKAIERKLIELGITRVARFDGDIAREDLDKIAVDLDRSYTDPKDCKYDVVLANYKKGGAGLNFTGITTMIILDEEWNPGKRDQAYARIARMGQTERTSVHVVRVKGSIDDGLAALMALKERDISEFDEIAERKSLIDYLEEMLKE